MSRVLIVDDQEQDRELLQVLLERSGYLVEAAADGADALAHARANPPDMIVSDILMPVMDGFSLCREWRKDERLRALPFVFYTATYTDPRDEELALGLGADRFIVKPVEPVKLLELLKEVLDSGRRSRATDSLDNPGKQYFKKYNEALVRKLEDKLELFRTIFNIDPSAIFLLSSSNTVLELNRTAANLLGVRGEEVLDKCFVDCFVPEAYRAPFFEQIKTSLSGSTIRDFESNIQLADGSERTLLWNAQRLMRASGAIEGVLLMGNDITARKRAEKQHTELEVQLRQAQKMEALGAFAGGIAHDFNNILTGIIGFVDMTRYEIPPGSAAAGNLHDALLAADHAKNLVNQILSISRRTEETFKPLEITCIIKEACKLLRASIPKSIDISLDIDSHCGTVFCDPTQIHQILMNLCTNAYHAIGDVNGAIGISCHVLCEVEKISVSVPILLPGDYIVIKVTDTGMGMSKATMEHIFDPYFSTKEKGKGTGLGLPVVKAIVRSHGGQIHVESIEQKGSTFRVFLPKFRTDAPLPDKIGLGKWEKGGNESILVVEDNEIIGPMFVRALTNLGYRVTPACDGLQAFAMFEQNPRSFDVVLTDLTMPKMGGLELAKRVHALQPKLPIILMSGSSELSAAQYKDFMGIKAFLKKPFDIRELSRTLKNICTAETAYGQQDQR